MKRKPRILHITDGIGKAGIERMIILRTKALQDDFEFGHLGLFGRSLLDSFFTERGDFAAYVGLSKKPLYFYPYYFTQVGKLSKIAREFAPDIVHMYYPPFQWVLSKVAKEVGAKSIHEAHNANIYRRKRLASFVERKGIGKVDAVVTVSRHVAEHYRDYFGADISNFEVVHNGIETDIFKPAEPGERERIRDELGILRDALVVGNIGRFTPGKRIHVLAAVFAEIHAEYPNLHLLLVGDGEKEKAVIESLRGVDESRIHLPGFVGNPETMFGALDIFVLPSINEAFPLVLLEAMASGVASISTAVGGAVEAGMHEYDCLYIPPDNRSALADAIRRLCEDTALREKLAVNARKTILDNFTVDKMVRKEAALYRRLLDL